MSLSEMMRNIVDFSEKFNLKGPESPVQQVPDLNREFNILLGEFVELEEVVKDSNRNRVADLVHETVDVIYAAMGILRAVGVDPSLTWEAVHASNMNKELSSQGQIIKPEGWKPPRILPTLRPLPPSSKKVLAD